MVNVVTRAATGTELTWAQVDGNFTALAEAVNTVGDEVIAEATAAKDIAVGAASASQVSATSSSSAATASAASAAASAASALDSAAYVGSLAAEAGAGYVGFNPIMAYAIKTAGWGIQTAGESFNLLRLIPPAEWPAISTFTSTYDCTPALRDALFNYHDVFAPPGGYVVDPDVGDILVPGMRLRGAAQNRTMFLAKAKGATTAQLAAYVKGSVFRRAYTPGVANSRCDTVHMSDYAIVLNHPSASVTTTNIQIGLDLRHVGRFIVERVWVGNIAPLGGPFAKTDAGAYAAQGYCAVVGNIDSSNIGYCGGEVGVFRDCSFYGAYKNVVLDDLVLSPLSGVHAISVVNCDIQGGHSLLVQEQQYTAGCVWARNTIQDVRRQPGNVSPTYVMRLAGYDNEIEPGYIEAGIADYLLRFDSASVNNQVNLTHYSATTIGIEAFSDAGLKNVVNCRANTGSLPGGVDSKGIPITRYNRAYKNISMVAHWNGSAMVKDGGFGITVTRPTTAGDYLFTFDLPFIDGNGYTWDVSYDTNASGHGGTHSIISHGQTNMRIQFYAQNGAVTTAIDPRFVSVKISQF